MPRQLWLADVLRSAGLTVHEVPGWQTRGLTDFRPQGLIVHETRGSLTSTDRGEINVMINGREGLAGPIAHIYLSRTGDWHVVTAGKSNHVKTGWAGPFDELGNTNLLGIEAQHSTGEPWTEVQYRSYVRGVAAILRHTGWQAGGHKEHQPGDKDDPAFDMNQFRRDVAAVQNGDDMTPAQEAHLKATDERVRVALIVGDDESVDGEYEDNDPDMGLTKPWIVRKLNKLADEVAALKTAPVEIDYDLLASKVSPLMEAAAERAVRKVLGAVDGK